MASNEKNNIFKIKDNKIEYYPFYIKKHDDSSSKYLPILDQSLINKLKEAYLKFHKNNINVKSELLNYICIKKKNSTIEEHIVFKKKTNKYFDKK